MFSLHLQRALLTTVGIFMVVFSLLALSGPGRIDIVDGQARFEVAKSIALHGDAVVRNPAVWFSVFPGRDGERFSYYRFPHSVLGAASILLSDFTGPNTDPRRHFWFVLVSAGAAASLACVYFWWFTRTGLRHNQALAWALAGIVCTPSWYYGTSTFDDILAALVVSVAVVFSLAVRTFPDLRWSFFAGALFGLAFNVKEPLGAFALVGICALDRGTDPSVRRVTRAGIFVLGLLLGIALYVGFDLYKFPSGTKAAHAALLAKYVPPFPGHFVWGLLVLVMSPCAGFVWYAPSVVLSMAGVRRVFQGEHSITRAFLVSCVIFFGFIASVSFCKGDPAWGPRYLTPLYAVLWLAAPVGSTRFRSSATALLLALSVSVQLLALSVDPSTIHLRRNFSPALSAYYPIVHFDWRNAQLIDRPLELAGIWRARNDPGERFSWSDPPTSQEDLLPWSQDGATVISRYKLLNSFRPWWISYRYIPINERPVAIEHTVAMFLAILLVGIMLLVFGLRQDIAHRCRVVRAVRGILPDAPDGANNGVSSPLRAVLAYDAVYPYTLGGVEYRNYALARLWAGRVNVTFLGFGYWHSDPARRLPGCQYESIGNARPLHDAAGKRRLADALAAAVGVTRALWRSEANVWEVANIPYLPLVAARVLSVVRRKPLVVTWHEFFGDRWSAYLGNRVKGCAARGVERLAMWCTPLAVTVSPLTRDRLLAAGFPADRVALVPNGVDAAGIAALQADPGARADLVYAGRLSPHKRVDLALRAFARLRDRHPSLTFRVIGDGPARPELERLAARLGVADAVTFDGFLPDEADVFRRMKAARVAVLASEREGFGLTLAQAWACGLPAVVCRGTENAMAGLVTDSILGFVTEPDPDAMAAACEQLLADTDATRRAARAAFARDQYDHRRVAAAVADILEAAARKGEW